MTENPKFERLLKLLMTLSNGIKYSIKELTDRYQLSKRSFYRDIETLRNSGFAIENHEGRYWIEKLPLDIFRISGSEKIPVKLRLSLRAYSLLIEEYPLSSEFISQINNNSWQYNGWVANYDGVARFVLGLCEDVKIVAPQGLKDFIKQKVKCLSK